MIRLQLLWSDVVSFHAYLSICILVKNWFGFEIYVIMQLAGTCLGHEWLNRIVICIQEVFAQAFMIILQQLVSCLYLYRKALPVNKYGQFMNLGH